MCVSSAPEAQCCESAVQLSAFTRALWKDQREVINSRLGTSYRTTFPLDWRQVRTRQPTCTRARKAGVTKYKVNAGTNFFDNSTHVASSELQTIRGEREGAHETLVGIQEANLLERLAIPVVQPNFLILKKKKKDGGRGRVSKHPGMSGLWHCAAHCKPNRN